MSEMRVFCVVQVCEAEYLYESRTRQMSISVSCRFVRLNAAISVNLKPNEDGEYAEVWKQHFSFSLLLCCVVFCCVALPAAFYFLCCVVL